MSIPAPSTRIIGREAEILQAQALLRRHDVQLLTLTGAGGVGKTRLALELARLRANDYADGVIFVPIAAVTEPAWVLPAIGAALGLETAGTPEALAAEIGERELLIILDNFEQVDAAAPLIAAFLRAAPGPQLLVTSRTPLRISGEHQLPVPPLAIPFMGSPASAAQLAEIPSVQLFTARAAAATGAFAVTDANAADVAAVCARLDGLPLAIELAAARLRHLSLPALVARLDQRLDLLVDGPRDAPARLQTLRDAIAWSYSLLPEAHQQLLRRLAVFSGGFTLAAAEAVANHDRLIPGDTLTGLSALLDNSLLVPLASDRPTPRFGMLESIHAFAAEQLAASEEHADVAARHRAHFLAVAQAAQAELEGPHAVTWREHLRDDQENLRHALQQAVLAGDRTLALQLGTALWNYWATHDYAAEGRRWLEAAVAMPGDTNGTLYVNAVSDLGNMALTRFDLDAADRHYRAALAIWQERGSADDVTLGRLGLGAVTRYRGQYAESEAHYRHVRDAWTADDDLVGMAIAEHCLGALFAEAGRPAESVAHHATALELRRRVGEPVALAYTLVSAAIAGRWAGDHAAAMAAATEGRVLFREAESADGEALAVLVLGRLAADAGHLDEALGLLRESCVHLQTDPSVKGIIETLETLAGALQRRSSTSATAAATLLAAASMHRTARGLVVPAPERTVVADLRAALAATLGVSAFSAAWSAGLRLSLEQAVAAALAAIDASLQGANARARFDLTRRETEVLALLAEHLSDREIADRLYLSPRTIERHVANILLKLETPNRRLASALAVREGLVAAASG